MNIGLMKPKLREIQLLVPDHVFRKVVQYFEDRAIQTSWNEKLISVMDFISKREWENP